MKDPFPYEGKCCHHSLSHPGLTWVRCSSGVWTCSSADAGAEEHFDGIVVDGVGQLQRLFLPRCSHHLQNLSGRVTQLSLCIS